MIYYITTIKTACLVKKQYRKMDIIRSRQHELFTEEVNKVALSADDDKRHILKDGIHTVAYAHCRYT